MNMRSIAALGLASAVMMVSSPLGAQDKPEELATRRAEAWLALVDQGKYEESWSDSSFEGKKEATETVTPMLDPDGIWRVSGYFIK